MKDFPMMWMGPALALLVAAPAPAVSAVLADLTAPTASTTAATPANPDLDAASALFQRGRYQDALPLAERATSASPDNVAARDLLGQVLTRLERPDEAVPTLAKASESDPKNVDVLIHLGEAQMTQYAKGLEAWKRVHGDNTMLGTITSDIPGAQAGGSHRYAPEGGPVLGETDKTSEMTRNPHEGRNPRFDPGHSAMGMLRRSYATMDARQREKYEAPARAALTTFERALEMNPNAAGALRGRAYAIYATGDYAAAGAAFDRAAKAAPDDISLHEMAADAYIRADAPNDAIRAWESVIRLNPVHPVAYKQLEDLYTSFRRARWERRYYGAMEHLLAGRPKDALGDLEWVTAKHPDFAPGWRAMGSAYLALKDNAKAVEHLTRALELDPESGLTEYELGVAHLRGDDIAAARAHLTRAAALRPDYAPAWFSLGVVSEKDKDPDSAIAAYERAVALRPNWAEAHFNLGALLLDRHQGAGAVEHLERYLALKPDAPDVKDVRKALDQVRALKG